MRRWHSEYVSARGYTWSPCTGLVSWRCPVGADAENWQQQRSLLRSAPLESMKAGRMQRMQKAKQAMGEHIWKAGILWEAFLNQQDCLTVLSTVAHVLQPLYIRAIQWLGRRRVYVCVSLCVWRPATRRP